MGVRGDGPLGSHRSVGVSHGYTAGTRHWSEAMPSSAIRAFYLALSASLSLHVCLCVRVCNDCFPARPNRPFAVLSSSLFLSLL
jgi:hypothetical protein